MTTGDYILIMHLFIITSELSKCYYTGIKYTNINLYNKVSAEDQIFVYTYRLRYIFWIDIAQKKIFAARPDGTNVLSLVSTGITTPGI